MYKVLVALKSQQQMKCVVTIDGKSKQIQLPQSEGLTFRVDHLTTILLKHNEELFKISINEDTTESTGEYKFTNYSGHYYIVIMQDIEKPSKLSIKQNTQAVESPLRKNQTERSLTASAKKFTFKTPSRQQKESNQKLTQSQLFLGDNLMEQIKQENLELKQKIVILENDILLLQSQINTQNEFIQKPDNDIKNNAAPQDLKNDFQNLLKLQQRQASENKQLLKQLMDLDHNYSELLEKKSQTDQELTKLKQTIAQFDCQISQLKSRLTQFEIDGLTQNIQQQIQVVQPIDNENEVIDNLIKQILKMRSTGAQYIPIKEDKIDVKLAQILAKEHTQQYQFIRLKQGLYQIGEEQMCLHISENKVLINTEDGEIPIQDFIKNRKRLKSIRK